MAALDLSPGLFVVDGTLGAGGHSASIVEKLGPSGTLLGIDRDPMMLDHATQELQDAQCRTVFARGTYAELESLLSDNKLSKPDRVLLDLGLSSDQLADESRGFSFQAEGPLDLRFDTSSGRPAWQVIDESSESELTEILQLFGEEPAADEIASALVQRRPVATATELTQLVTAVKSKTSRENLHDATLTFQALRIAVNEELRHVERMLNDVLPAVLGPGGRAVVISFHSLEDRIVKNAFRKTDIWQNQTAKPVTATPAESRLNPRARSAKLRVAVRR
ncbi:Ribosomal RNA small subunit methyltransferase H [Stratiformator vulcanicus]|uniref:Ribosomal RNA small subunit methyltransferase H n=2 Tax=Stratiformator vulcanicus TaxID=2527980 RepID=A0A517R2D7_9PLAN|nr:Ribosomal RNA small subunit methyltransferase H [Stratiformator vulcanicus]